MIYYTILYYTILYYTILGRHRPARLTHPRAGQARQEAPPKTKTTNKENKQEQQTKKQDKHRNKTNT